MIFSTRKNFNKTEMVNTVQPPVLNRVKRHWFIKGKGFHMDKIYDGKAFLFTWTEDRGHAFASKWALYFDLVDSTGNVSPCFIGFQNDGVGFYLGTGYDFGKNFDYGEFAQRFYRNIYQVREKYTDFLDFSKWMMSPQNASDLLSGSVSGLNIDYNVANINPWNFFSKRGTQSLECLVGSYDGMGILDTNIPMELIGNLLKMFDSDLTGLIFDFEALVEALEKGLQKIEFGKTAAIKYFPATSFNEDNVKIYHIHKNENMEIGSSPQATVHIGLNDLPLSWDANFLEGL